jgi:hypothetical protein
MHVSRSSLLAFAAELALVVAVYSVYSTIRVFVEGTAGAAWDNAASVIALEQSLGIFNEQAVQELSDDLGWPAVAARWFYFWGYLPFIGAAAITMYLRDRRLYRQYRNVMFASAAVGLVCFALIPTAPPRMVPEFGFVDSLNGMTASNRSWKNEFAAIPSFHVGWTSLAAIGLAHSFRFRPVACVLAAIPPLLMMLAVVATANHFWIDGLIGVAIVLSLRALLVRGDDDDLADERLAPAPAPLA